MTTRDIRKLESALVARYGWERLRVLSRHDIRSMEIMKTRFTYYSAPWGYPTTVIGHRAGRYFDIRQDGWGGYVVSGMIPANEITMKMVRVAPQAGWREAILKYLARL